MARTQPSEEENEGDFEYEYSDETEDFYFTLDVTTHAPSTATNPIETTPNKNLKGKQAAGRSEQQLEVLDLHSDNPLIKLGDSFYSCRWSTDFGTQFYVAKAGTVKQSLRSGHVLDVVGMSQARLTGKPATLHRHDAKTPTPKAVGSSSANAIVLDDVGHGTPEKGILEQSNAPSHLPTTKNIQRLAAARSKARDPNVKAQASFLERLAIIKQRKGERDIVPVYGIEELSENDHAHQDANASINSNGKRTTETTDGSELAASTTGQRTSMGAETSNPADHDDQLGPYDSGSALISQQSPTTDDNTMHRNGPVLSQQDVDMG